MQSSKLVELWRHLFPSKGKQLLSYWSTISGAFKINFLWTFLSLFIETRLMASDRANIEVKRIPRRMLAFSTLTTLTLLLLLRDNKCRKQWQRLDRKWGGAEVDGANGLQWMSKCGIWKVNLRLSTFIQQPRVGNLFLRAAESFLMESRRGGWWITSGHGEA